MSKLTLLSGLSVSLLMALSSCAPEDAPEDAVDELDVDESATEYVEPVGKSDHASDTYTYYSVRGDRRLCAWPRCGGLFVKRVNRQYTRCADGSWQKECYVADVDWAALGFSDERAAELRAAASAGRVLLRGQVAAKRHDSFGTLSMFLPEEAWLAGSDHEPAGVFVKVTMTGIRCITYPCPVMREAKLNSQLVANIAGLDYAFEPTEDELAAIDRGLASPNGLIVAGYRDYVTGPAGTGKTRRAHQFYVKAEPTSQEPCFVGGCSGQVCSDQAGVITTCEWRPEYACYRTATCERQPDGKCGWTPTPELEACLGSTLQ